MYLSLTEKGVYASWMLYACICILFSFTAFSQNQEKPNNQSLDEVVVTANRLEQKQSLTGKVVTVLTDSTLKRYSNQSLGELLSKQVGFSIVGSQNVLGTNQELYLRGASTGNTLILLDGIPVSDPSLIAPSFDLNFISIAEIERIEIIKSSQSTLYGSDAVAGVINIITKKGKKENFSNNVSLNAGSFGTFNGSAGIQQRQNRFSYGFQVNGTKSKGFSAASKQITDKTAEFEKDGFQQYGVMANASFQVNEKLSLNARTLLNNYTNSLDAGAYADEKDFVGYNKYWLLAAGSTFKKNKTQWFLNYAYSKSERIYEDDSVFVEKAAFNKYALTNYIANAHFVELYGNIKVSEKLNLVVGSDSRLYLTDQSYFSISGFGRYESPTLGKDSANIQIYSLFSNAVWKASKNLNLEVGGRLNVHSLYGTNYTYSFNPSYLVNERVKFFTNLSSGFRVPSLYQLFSPYGNKNLKPEKSNSWEIGSQYFSKNKNTVLSITYFSRRTSDVIIFQSLMTDPYGIYINLDKQKDRGWEIEIKNKWKKIAFFGNLSLVNGKVTTKVNNKDSTYQNLIRRPKESFNFGANYDLSKKSFVGINFRFVGERTDRFYNSQTYKSETVILKSYSLIDISGGYKLNERFSVVADLKNIFNKNFTEISGYNTRGFNFQVGLRFQN